MAVDMSALAPPKRKVTATGAKASVPPVKTAKSEPAGAETPQSNLDRRNEGLNGLGQLAQGLCIMTGQYADAATIGKFFPSLAHELAKAADISDTLAKPIDVLISVGPYGALVVAGMPLVLQLMANHGAVDPKALAGLGVVSPEILDAQMKTEILRQQALAVQEQQRAMEDAEKAQAELASAMERQVRMVDIASSMQNTHTADF